MSDDFGDRMKLYEQVEAGRKAMPLLPIIIRLDGKGFSKWTKGLERPYDTRLSDIMVEVTEFLVDQLDARIGFTESDEISLVLYSDDIKKEVFYNGKIQKLVSVSASMATAIFNLRSQGVFDKPVAFFDSRVWTVPNLAEAANAILWREQDATKNSISMAARCYYSHKELQNKNGAEMQEMLFQKGVNWNDYPSFFKRGTFVQRRKEKKKFSVDEIEKLPKQHAARKDPNLEIERSVIRRLDMPKFSSVTNRVGVIFNGEDPIID
jgi:tRNA(His) 5'-end guanylyltransferase